MTSSLPSFDPKHQVPAFVYLLPEKLKKWVLRRFYPETQVKGLRQRS